MEGTQAVVAIVRAEPFMTGKFFNIKLNGLLCPATYVIKLTLINGSSGSRSGQLIISGSRSG